MRTLKPELSVVPIVVAAPERPIKELLGTGFFVEYQNGVGLMTAWHIFEGRPLANGEKYCFVLNAQKGIQIHKIRKILRHPDYDIAFCPKVEVEDSVPLSTADTNPALNDEILSYEYSYSTISYTMDGRGNVVFSPLAHKGNIVLYFESTFPEAQAVPSLLTSFPAFQGASGAPVIWVDRDRRDFSVAGMLVGNLETEMLPAQTVSIREGASRTEETRYFHPYGRGIQRKLLMSVLDLYRGG